MVYFNKNYNPFSINISDGEQQYVPNPYSPLNHNFQINLVAQVQEIRANYS